MAFFNQILDDLFPDKSGKRDILLHEPIKRSKNYIEDYSLWSDSFKRTDLLQSVYNSYELKKQGIAGSLKMHLFNSPTANGLAISYHESIDQKEFSYLFDWLGEQIYKLKYKRVNSDVTITSKKESIETLSRYYFKPKIDSTNTNGLIDQQYGNILIEHITIDNAPTLIRFIANNYQDRQYEKAEDFEKLAEFLFSK